MCNHQYLFQKQVHIDSCTAEFAANLGETWFQVWGKRTGRAEKDFLAWPGTAK